MDILLHICCAPCAIYPIERLRAGGHRIAGFYYNPNIHPYSEYLKRQDAVEGYEKEAGVNIFYGDYTVDDYFEQVIYDDRSRERCPVCWWLRLKKTAGFAKEHGFEAFTTTLLASPYQDHDALKCLGEEVAAAAGLTFYYEDFRPGFRDAQQRAKEKGIYRQNYCGCLYSEIERIEKMAPHSRLAARGKDRETV